ncbi:MAG: DNA repair protein RecO [Candidatus Kerfeldbacteria bacterium]|nr:DNA repair protein RecO [Candidatus Kerfeldbacteria bacterium]
MSLSRRVGIILNRKNVGAVDRRITLFCADGKHELRARGTQKLASKLAGSLEPLTLVELTVAKGRTSGQITGSSILDSFKKIRSNMARIAGAALLASAVDSLVHGRLDERTPYRRIRESFVLLGRSLTNREVYLAVAYGLWNLVSSLGFHPPIEQLILRPSARRLVAVLLEGEYRSVPRIRCSLITARECVEMAMGFAQQCADREFPAATFFRRILDANRRSAHSSA